MPSYKDLSNAISLVLYSMGYDNSKTRKPVVTQQDSSTTNCICVGSKEEGVADEDSDLDFISVVERMYCSDHPDTKGLFDEKKMKMHIGLETVSEKTAPGYTMLRFQNRDDAQKYASASRRVFYIRDMNGHTFFAHNLLDFSQLDLAEAGLNVSQQSIHGPAFKVNLDLEDEHGKFESKYFDLAFVIPFFSSYLHRWTEHKFPYGWPSPALLKEIRQMHGYVAAVGNKCSKYCDMEWRICYTEVEIKLVHSLNNTQLYVYILLKRIAKHILKPVCRESCITSYMIKNLVLWMAALLPTRHFQKGNLILMLIVSLKILYNHVKKNYLPNFMIPERNLISERLTEEDRENVIKVLEEVLQNGPYSIFQHSGFSDLNHLIEKASVSLKSFELEKESKACVQKLMVKFLNGDTDVDSDDQTKLIKNFLHLCCGIDIDELNKMSDKEFEDLLENVDLETAMPLVFKKMCHIM